MENIRSIYAVYRKEMSHYFVSPIAYVIVAVFLFLSAYFFNRLLAAMIQGSLQTSSLDTPFGSLGGVDVPAEVVRNFFGILSMILLFLTPLLTMGVYAEERKHGTMELLMTSPINDIEIVLGKLLASLTLFLIMLLPTFVLFAYIFLHSEPAASWRMLGCAYLGVFLLGAALFALGSFFSSITESQLIAAVLSFGAMLLLWIMDFWLSGDAHGITAAAQYASVFEHYDDFIRGVLDTSHLIFYVSFIFLGVFLTVRSVDSMRWRRA